MATRRQTILGIGVLVGGAGAITATGAFDTVEAERQVSVEFADDASAALTMEPSDRAVGEGEGEQQNPIEVYENDDGEIEINLVVVNRNARVTFSDLVTFTNNGSQDISSLSFSMENLGNEDHGELSIYSSDGENILEEADLEGDEDTLEVGQEVTGLGVAIETRESQGYDLSGVDSEDIDLQGRITVSATV